MDTAPSSAPPAPANAAERTAALPSRPARGSRISATAERRWWGMDVADWRNLGLLLLGWIALLLLLPPAHEYAIIDDWIYSDSVRDQLATGRFVMPDQSQANLVGLTLWGTLWARLFGFSVTTLTFSTLALAIGGLLAFYGLARRVGVSPNGSLLAVALLGLNPLWLHLSYSFMTDVPFVALALMSAYAYIRGLDSEHPAWLVAGGLLSGWAFLVRQFGILVPAGFLLYLVIDALLTRKPRWLAMALVVVVPAAIVGVWWQWNQTQPVTSAERTAEGWRAAFVGKPVWVEMILMRALVLLPLAGLSVPLVLRWPRCYWKLLLVSAAVLFILILSWPSFVNEPLIGQTEPPFRATLGPFGFELPRQPFTFGVDGSIVRVEGINFYGYTQERLWSPEAWRALFVIGTALGVLLLVAVGFALFRWVRERAIRSPVPPVAGFYLSSLLICGVTLALTGQIYDRYLLGFLPALLLFAVRGTGRWNRWAWSYAIGASVVLAAFSILLKADAMDHTNARWQAATWIQQRGPMVWAGLDWNRGVWLPDWPYQVTDIPIAGYRTEKTFTYTSRLSGWTTRTVYAQVRADIPPLKP